MATDPKQLLGTTLSGRYRIEKVIGEGGMGAIFQATQLSLGRAVAIKVVKCVHGDDSDAVRRFELETEVIARLAHPNIVQVVDAGKADDGTMYLAMELLDGDSIRGLLRKLGTVPVGRALAIVEDVASALAAAHAGGVIHRDLKAENVMLVRAAGKQEIAKVLDFGVAKLTTKTEAPPQTGSGFVAGTPGCIAPEQMLGKSDEPRSDLYSVGVLFFEMLAGEPPFIATSSVELMLRHLTEPAPRVADIARARGRADVPAPVDDLIASLLAKDPEVRPRSAEALVEIVSSLRDASRATQPDLRMPTPFGGQPVPTPGALSSVPTVSSVAVPTPLTVSASPAPAPTGSAAVPAPSRFARFKSLARRVPIPVRIAGVVALTASTISGGMWAAAEWADRDIPGFSFAVSEAWNKWKGIEHAFLSLDVDRVRSSADFVIKRGEVPWAHLYLAQLAMLERAPLSDVDEHLARAVESADKRAALTSGTTHTQRLVAALAAVDPKTARKKWQEHLDAGGCEYGELELQMFAAKLTYTEIDGDKLAATYRELLGPGRFGSSYDDDWKIEDQPPIARVGYVRALRHQRKYAEAEALLAPLQKANPKSPILLDVAVDLALAQGNVDRARTLLREHLAFSDALRPTIRLAGLDLATRKDALDGALGRARSLLDTNPLKTDSLAWMGNMLAARGMFAEADALWREAVAAAIAKKDSTRVANVAVFAAMVGAVVKDIELADRWHQVFQDHSLGLKPSASTARMQAMALANRLMIQAYKNAPAAEVARTAEALQGIESDVPLIANTVQWHVFIEKGQVDEAMNHAERLPLCFREAHVGMAYAEQGPGKSAEAYEHLLAATTPELEAYCTTGDDFIPFVQSMLFAKALGYRASAAMRLKNRAGAEEALNRLHAIWPFVSSTNPAMPAEWQTYVTDVETWLRTPAQP